MAVKKRVLSVFLSAALLAGCSGGDQPNGPGVGQVVMGVAGGLISRVRPGTGEQQATPPASLEQLRAGLTDERLAEIGRPVILAQRTSTGATAAMVQAGQNGPVQSFVSPDGISVSLHSGVLRATRGIAPDLMASSDPNIVLSRIRAGSGQATRVFRWIDGDGSLLRQSVRCEYRHDADAVVERCLAENGGGFENRYWLSQGRIRASIQLVSAEVGYLYIEQLSY